MGPKKRFGVLKKRFGIFLFKRKLVKFTLKKRKEKGKEINDIY